jgi:hypothetical protein
VEEVPARVCRITPCGMRFALFGTHAMWRRSAAAALALRSPRNGGHRNSQELVLTALVRISRHAPKLKIAPQTLSRVVNWLAP